EPRLVSGCRWVVLVDTGCVTNASGHVVVAVPPEDLAADQHAVDGVEHLHIHRFVFAGFRLGHSRNENETLGLLSVVLREVMGQWTGEVGISLTLKELLACVPALLR